VKGTAGRTPQPDNRPPSAVSRPNADVDADASQPSRPEAGITVLAIDFGTKTLGVAVGDTETRMAHPVGLIEGEANAGRFAALEALLAEWQPARLVVGLPLALDGSEHDMTRRARRFARQLEARFALPVALADERLSSVSAESMLREAGRGGRKHKHEAHALAASVFLQAWLDGQPRSG
jgi:putative Holliday junction resolvase